MVYLYEVARQVSTVNGVEVELAHQAPRTVDFQGLGAVPGAPLVRDMLPNGAAAFRVWLEFLVKTAVRPLLRRNRTGRVSLGPSRCEHESAGDFVVQIT
jgi:hypothetical protein